MVIVFYTPSNPERRAVKRIVALEGDRVQTRADYPVKWVDVPVGHVWVEGDNVERDGERSRDSNYYGPVSKGLVVGKVVGVVWPWGRRGWLKWEGWRGDGRVLEGYSKVHEVQFY